MILLIKLLLAHFIGDFLLQPLNWVNEKFEHKIKSSKLYLHAAIHGLLAFAFIADLGAWLPVLCLMAIHLLIDILKLYAQNEKSQKTWFFLDQALHLISIWAIWRIALIHVIPNNPNTLEIKIWLYATAVVFLTSVSGLIIQLVIKHWTELLKKFDQDSLPGAGKYIGMLERLFVLIFITTDHWEAIGFLIAAKSVFRFGDLKEAKEIKLTEYILIGTLMSFGIAILTGLIVKEIIGYLK
jgi:hypothetical protein